LDVRLLLEREAQAGNAVVEERGAHPKARLVEQHAGGGHRCREIFVGERGA
jgi:hypothetical protein